MVGDRTMPGRAAAAASRSIATRMHLQVQTLLDEYIVALETMYNENREKYNVPSTKPPLTII